MADSLGFWWQPCPGGARVLRVLGDTPCPALPPALAGVPLAELGPYCFAERPFAPPAGARFFGAGDGGGHAIAGLFLEELCLPDTVHTLHSAALYNCRRLARLEVGAGLAGLGSDLFTNCRALARLAVRAAPGQATGLKRLLGALSGDITVEFRAGGAVAAQLFYPEYWEVLDENAPAHLFDRGIEGEGYRYRQCFVDGAVDWPAYDAAFARAAQGEAPAKMCRLALYRLLWPHALGQAARAAYEGYLARQAAPALAVAVDGRDIAALRLLLGLGLPPAQIAAACAGAGWSAGAATLFSQGGHAQKRYDFDSF